MTYVVIKTLAKNSSYSFEENSMAYKRLLSIDAVIVAIELAMATERSFSEAVDFICSKCGSCYID